MWTARRDAASMRAQRLSRLRLATFFGGGALLWRGLSHGPGAVTAMGIAAFIAFVCCVVLHARVLDQVERADAAIDVNTMGAARLARDWRVLPDVVPPPALDFDTHPYPRDLALFGQASLSKLLGAPARADGGASAAGRVAA